MSERTIDEIEDDLDKLQQQYISEDDDIRLMELERKFAFLLDEATEVDGRLRNAVGVVITNWVRS
jgi:hypothetical protein